MNQPRSHIGQKTDVRTLAWSEEVEREQEDKREDAGTDQDEACKAEPIP
jgi:hypothetical protein